MPLSKNQKLGIGIGAVAAAVGVVAIATKGEAALPEDFCCPHCPECFPTYEELRTHVEQEHPGERTPLEIEWS